MLISCTFSSITHAGGIGADIDAQPIGMVVLGNLKLPGLSAAKYFVDTAVGAHARLDVYFMFLSLDYQHLFSENIDYINTGLGAEFGLPLANVEKRKIARAYVRGSMGLLILEATVPQTDPTTGSALGNSRKNLLGGSLNGSCGIDYTFNEWFYGGVNFVAGVNYTSGISFIVSLNGFLGVTI